SQRPYSLAPNSSVACPRGSPWPGSVQLLSPSSWTRTVYEEHRRAALPDAPHPRPQEFRGFLYVFFARIENCFLPLFTPIPCADIFPDFFFFVVPPTLHSPT